MRLAVRSTWSLRVVPRIGNLASFPHWHATDRKVDSMVASEMPMKRTKRNGFSMARSYRPAPPGAWPAGLFLPFGIGVAGVQWARIVPSTSLRDRVRNCCAGQAAEQGHGRDKRRKIGDMPGKDSGKPVDGRLRSASLIPVQP